MHSKMPVVLFMVVVAVATLAQDHPPLPDTKPLALERDLSAQIVAGIDASKVRRLYQKLGTRG